MSTVLPSGGPTTPSMPSQSVIEEAWGYYQHGDNLYHSRQNIFLLAHTLLLTAFVTITGNEDPHALFRFGVATVGTLAGFNWYFVVSRLPPRLKKLTKLYLRHSIVYHEYLNAIPEKQPPQEGGRWLRELFLPVCFTGLWVVVLLSMALARIV